MLRISETNLGLHQVVVPGARTSDGERPVTKWCLRLRYMELPTRSSNDLR